MTPGRKHRVDPPITRVDLASTRAVTWPGPDHEELT